MTVVLCVGRNADFVKELVRITKRLLMEFNSQRGNKRAVCPIEVLMEECFDEFIADAEDKPSRKLLASYWSAVERAVVQDKRISTVKEEVAGKVQRCWRFLDSKSIALY
jgi:hypothetical protein